MNNKDLAHRWANQTQESGRGSHFFFEGRALYSYGYHFKVAEHVKDHAGHVFFNRASYSSSTQGHQSHARRALGDHLKVWRVADFEDHAANVRAYLEDMETARANALRARSNAEGYRDAALAAATLAGEYAQEFGTKGDRKLKRQAFKAAELARSGALFNAEELAGVRERVAAAREAARAQAKARDAQAAAKRAEMLEKLEAWARGDEGAQAPGGWDLPTRLRLKDGRIETSRGAQITERAARVLWAALTTGRDVAGFKLDGYAVRSWDGAALVVGCHTIPREELARMAGLLGLSGVL